MVGQGKEILQDNDRTITVTLVTLHRDSLTITEDEVLQLTIENETLTHIGPTQVIVLTQILRIFSRQRK